MGVGLDVAEVIGVVFGGEPGEDRIGGAGGFGIGRASGAFAGMDAWTGELAGLLQASGSPCPFGFEIANGAFT